MFRTFGRSDALDAADVADVSPAMERHKEQITAAFLLDHLDEAKVVAVRIVVVVEEAQASLVWQVAFATVELS